MIERGIRIRIPTDTKFLNQKLETLKFHNQKLETLKQLKVIHANLLKLPFSANTTSVTPLLSDAAASANTDLLSYASVVFQSLHSRTTFQYNTMIRGYLQSNQPFQAILCYKDMMKDGLIKNNYTFTPLVKACSVIAHECRHIGLSVHAHAVKLGHSSDLFIASALIELYASNLDMGTAEELFKEMPLKDVVLWTTMINGYGKMGDIEKARALFDKMPERNVISWSAIIAAYSQRNDFSEVLTLYKRMEELGLKPNESILVSAVTACARLGALAQGVWIHSYAEKCRYVPNPILSTALIDMYSKCGRADLALTVFEEIQDKDSQSWNSIISGVALNGDVLKSLELFNDMIFSGTQPTDATFVSLLTACTHANIVFEGLSLFESMSKDYNVEPKTEHYACVVDLLARSGGIEKAERFIDENIYRIGEWDVNIWGALLGACRIHGKVDIGDRLWRKLADNGISDHGIHVLAYNMYREAGWETEAKNVRRQIETKEMKKKPGCSVVEVDGRVEEFVAGDVLHPQAGKIGKILNLVLCGISSSLTVCEYDDII